MAALLVLGLTPMTTPEQADVLARTAHHGQVDKAGNPYIEHVRAVAAALTHHGPNAVMAGLLHDVVEDTHITLDDLRKRGYPEEVASAVDSVTKRPGETYMDMVRRAAADPLGRLVKLADNANNSDPARLALLDPEQADWFRQQYAKAREVLHAALTMEDLYPNGTGYHRAHEPYIRAVADALTASGVKVLNWYADPNDPRDGAIQVDVFALDYDEVWLGWQEERRWTVLLIEEHEDRPEPSRWVHYLDAGTVFSPESVVRAFAEHMKIALDPPGDTFPDLDFPEHTFEADNIELELALRWYAEGDPR